MKGILVIKVGVLLTLHVLAPFYGYLGGSTSFARHFMMSPVLNSPY